MASGRAVEDHAVSDDGFLRRWSRLKRGGEVEVEAEPVFVPDCAHLPVVVDAPAVDAPPPPTLEDAAALHSGSDFSAFVGRNVDAAVRRLAMKKLFADAHFQGHDGLDIYMGDYNLPSPVSADMFEQLAHSKRMFGKLDEALAGEAGSASPTEATSELPPESPPESPDQEVA
jgi:hypothetical protein